MSKLKLLVAVLAAMTLLLVPASAFAQPVPPCAFAGTVYTDSHMVVGAEVTAYIEGAEVGDTVTDEDGSYYIQIAGSSYAGKEVSFEVEGVDAEETGTWTMGAMNSLDLHTTSLL